MSKIIDKLTELNSTNPDRIIAIADEKVYSVSQIEKISNYIADLVALARILGFRVSLLSNSTIITDEQINQLSNLY